MDPRVPSSQRASLFNNRIPVYNGGFGKTFNIINPPTKNNVKKSTIPVIDHRTQQEHHEATLVAKNATTGGWLAEEMHPSKWGFGAWFVIFSSALRARTKETIDEFIRSMIPIMVNLLCEECSDHAYVRAMNVHPNGYRNIVDHRGENVGMYLWLIDFKNDVNKREGNPVLSVDQVNVYYKPLLDLTTKEIMEDRVSAMKPETMENLHKVTFICTDCPDEPTPVLAQAAAPLSSVSSTPSKTPLPLTTNNAPIKTQGCKTCGKKR
jgi:hypothetical protein